MKNTKCFGLLLLILFTLCLAGCEDEDCLYLTKDEIVEGDINTGRQVRIGSTITIYNGDEFLVNVAGNSGKITAVSTDDKIAKINSSISAYGGMTKEIQAFIIEGISIGNATIHVYDEDGKEVTLKVRVEDVESQWKEYATYTIDTASRHCIVTGVTEDIAKALGYDVLTNNQDYKFVMKSRWMAPSDTYRLQIYDKDNNLISQKIAGNIERKERDFNNGEGTIKEEWHFMSYDYIMEKHFYNIVVTTQGQKNIVKDISSDYTATYPNIKVQLWMPY